MVYRVNEIFLGLQGEGARTGTLNVFVRFTGCNLRCNTEEDGFDCDTEFTSTYRTYSDADSLVGEILDLWGSVNTCSVILTGGEPSLQIDSELIGALSKRECYIAIETNGTKELPSGIDWVSCSPKTAEHTIKLKSVNELRYVRGPHQGIPLPQTDAAFYYLSPASGPFGPNDESLPWCMRLIRENPRWRLSTQLHKSWGIR